LLNEVIELSSPRYRFGALTRADLGDYFVVDRSGMVKQAGGRFVQQTQGNVPLAETLPMLKNHLEDAAVGGAFYNFTDSTGLSPENLTNRQTLYIGPLPDTTDLIGLVFNVSASLNDLGNFKSELVILSLISQAVRAFNRAENLETILKIVLIGVTAGCGLGFNRAFVLLTCDEQNCLRGALANGPNSPEEANAIWQKLSKGEITLKQMFDDALQNDHIENPPLNGFLKNIVIPLTDRNNIFAKAALQKKSMIIDEATLATEEHSTLHSMIGPGPMAVVPLFGHDYLQGVLIADNFITRKEITENDLHLLEIFARYASDSIKNFRLYESLEKKVEALKRANETIINNRENMIKAERLSVLAEMAGDVAHEIRNPLTIIGGFAKSMLKKMPENDANLEYLKIIFEQVERINQSLDNFTSLINYESTSDRVCDLGDIVKSAVDVKIPGSGFGPLEVTIEDKIEVRTDPDLLRQAFIIVLKQANSINHDKAPMSIVIRRRQDKALVFINRAEHSDDFAMRIYKSFYSGGNYELLKQLSTTLEILKYYRGNIGIESSHDKAKNFYLELPVFKEEQ
jgi:hypothetical protein